MITHSLDGVEPNSGPEGPNASHGGYVPPLGLRRSPWLLSLSFTHIFQMDFVKRPEKRGAVVECFTVSTVSLRSASSPPKMWVKDSHLCGGDVTPPTGTKISLPYRHLEYFVKEKIITTITADFSPNALEEILAQMGMVLPW